MNYIDGFALKCVNTYLLVLFKAKMPLLLDGCYPLFYEVCYGFPALCSEHGVVMERTTYSHPINWNFNLNASII